MIALVEQRAGRKEPDVLAVRVGPGRRAREKDGGGGVALAPPRTRIVRQSSREAYAGRASRIVVRHVLGPPVAVIEIVSPGNKDSRAELRDFVRKSVAFVQAGVHVLVVDLFPPGPRDPLGVHRLIWEEFEDDGGGFEFPAGKNLVLASYSARRPEQAFVEPLAAGEAMPDMPLFLDDDAEVEFIPVPLQQTYDAAWTALPAAVRNLVSSGATSP